MTVQEWWWVADKQEEIAKQASSSGTSKFTSAEWAEARRKHKVKTNGSG